MAAALTTAFRHLRRQNARLQQDQYHKERTDERERDGQWQSADGTRRGPDLVTPQWAAPPGDPYALRLEPLSDVDHDHTDRDQCDCVPLFVAEPGPGHTGCPVRLPARSWSILALDYVHVRACEHRAPGIEYALAVLHRAGR